MKHWMTPQTLTERLQRVCGARLQSVMLFGSAAAGDHEGARSDYNVLIVLDRLGLEELTVLSPLARAWVKGGNPSPLLLTKMELAKAAEVFPMEIADMKEHHLLLAGEDVLSRLPVHAPNLRIQLEHELKGKLLQLRARYLLVQGRPRDVTELMVRSLSTFLILCRGALRLYQPMVPGKKLEALAALANHVPVRPQVFETIAQLKTKRRVPGVVPEQLFAEYLQAIKAVVDAVDARLHPDRPPA